jgi:hypothetical protein
LWPSESAVMADRFDRPYWERHAERAIERWSFVVGERGLAAMRRHLEGELEAPVSNRPGWRSGASSYHLFHHCHHFTASALRDAGLPIGPWWAFNATLIGVQLDRVSRYHDGLDGD